MPLVKPVIQPKKILIMLICNSKLKNNSILQAFI
jgi:hypothetical protein